jgi:hypothetical protein
MFVRSRLFSGVFLLGLMVLLLPMAARAEYITQHDVASLWLFIFALGVLWALFYIFPILNLILACFCFWEVMKLPIHSFTYGLKQQLLGTLFLLHVTGLAAILSLHGFSSLDIRWGCFFLFWFQSLLFVFLRLWKRTKYSS